MQTHLAPHRFPLLRHSRPQGVFVLALACVAAMAVSPAMAALEEITEAELSVVTAQDGVKVALTDTSTTVDYLRWNIDNGAGAAFPAYQAWLDLDDITWTGVNSNGSSTGLSATAALAFDAGAPGSASTEGAALALSLVWTRSRLRIDAFRHSQHAGKSFGSAAYDSSGSFAFQGGSGLFNNGSTRAGMRLIITDGEWYYRQANNANTTGNEFLWDNLNVNIGFDGGTLGLTNAGLRVAAPRLDFNMTWDIGFRGNMATASAFRSDTGYAPYLRYGWTGGLTDVEMILSGGGVRSGGGGGSRTEGVHFSFRGTPATDFAWLIGDPGGAPLLISFTDWVTMPSATYGINAPDITIDALRLTEQGPGGFLYQGVNYDVRPADGQPGGLAVVIRDLKFLSYNTKVLLHDTSAAVVDKTFNWGLVYTVGDLDLNLFVYPGGKGTLNEGIRFDLTLGIQSPGTWNQNSHYMLVDTDPGKNVGVGFVNTNFLITINNGYLSLLPTGMELETLTDFRWRLKSQFGGGYITDLSTPVRMVDIDMDLHASRINLLFQPPPTGTASGSEYIGYQWDARLYQGTVGATPAGIASADTYIAISEPSRPLTQVKFGKISGDIGVRGGKISIKASNESADGYPRLSFEQNLQFGITAGLSADDAFTAPAAAQPFIISDFSIGTNNIGAIAIPGGNWFARFELKEQI